MNDVGTYAGLSKWIYRRGVGDQEFDLERDFDLLFWSTESERRALANATGL